MLCRCNHGRNSEMTKKVTRIHLRKCDYKFFEDEYISEISDYIESTYSQHYSKKKFQASEFIYDAGHGTGFNMGNVMKYAQRYGNKGTTDDHRKDLMKVIHYAILQLYVHDQDCE